MVGQAPPTWIWRQPPSDEAAAAAYIAATVRSVELLDRWRPGRVAPLDTDPPAVREWKRAEQLMTVVGSRGGTYFIDECSEVYSADDCGQMHHWCLAIRDNGMPIADRSLVKLLLIQADEDLFTSTAKGGPPHHGAFVEGRANVFFRAIEYP